MYFGTISHSEGKPLKADKDLKVTANWGYLNQGATMPSTGKVIERDYTADERKAIERGAQLLGLNTEEALAHLPLRPF